MNSNYNNKNRARSHSIKCNNKIPDLIDSYVMHKKIDPGLLLCCSYNTSAESSTSSQMQYAEPIRNKTIHFKLHNPEPISVSNISVQKKLGANYYDLNRKADYHPDAKKGIMELEEGVVCSMCGDEGIAELLFLCSKCSYRPQHIYCSRSYPDLCGEASICNWCLHEEDSLTSSVVKASRTLNKTNVFKVNSANGRHGNANVIMHPIEVLNYPAAHVNEASQDEYKDDVSVKNGHGKAFEYLLLIAAQSLPQVISEATAEIKQANHTPSILKITNPKMGSLDNRANSDLDKKNIDMGSIDNKANTSTLDNEAGLMMGLDSKQSMELHNSEDKMDVGVLRGNIPKRQRCSKGINTSLKFRKKGLQLSPSRPNYRRYKLLADVVC